jgi:ATP phosphoribosyltransferase regulatory subunit
LGYEVFDRANPLAADAEVFALFFKALSDLPIRTITGDIGIILAAIEALSTTDARKAALRRHVWRPRRFRALLDRFTGAAKQPHGRAEYLAAAEKHGLASLMAKAGASIGLRTPEEIADRLERLRVEAASPPIDAMEAEILTELMALKAPVSQAVDLLGNFAVDLPGLRAAVNCFADRAAALQAAGIDTDAVPFEASYGRAQMEYYDGFVFGFLSTTPGRPPLATGGRYDALTRRLGDGREIPAVGGVIRPELVHRVREGLK